MEKRAILSPCGTYRYSLTREWDAAKPKALFIMLNPSTADALDDDPTIRRCIAFAKGWGYGSIMVGNLYAYRSTEPRNLIAAPDAIGRDNQVHLDGMMLEADIIIMAWGNRPTIKQLDKLYPNYRPLANAPQDKLHILAENHCGTPGHPLYLKSDLKPIPALMIYVNDIE